MVYPSPSATSSMSSRTTLAWSLLSSGIVTIVLTLLPGSDLLWGIGLCALGIAAFVTRSRRGF
jgi:hypothetical protein